MSSRSWSPHARLKALRAVLLTMLMSLAWCLPVRAEIYWYAADEAAPVRYVSPAAACWGWGQRYWFANATATAPGAQWRIQVLAVNPVDPTNEYQCSITIQKRNSAAFPWLPYLVAQPYSVYTAGNSCAVGPADSNGYCCPKCMRNECNGSNPIAGSNGNKNQDDTDYAAAEPSALIFKRYYNHLSDAVGELGVNWRHHYQRNVLLTDFDATTQPPSPLSAKIYLRLPLKIGVHNSIIRRQIAAAPPTSVVRTAWG